MRCASFVAKGVFNSFRIPFFRTYHKTLLAPPKSAIVGMLCNISLKPQRDFFEILNQDRVKVSVVVEKIGGRAKDMWSFKTLQKDNRGRSVVRRDKLFGAVYRIYFSSDDEALFEEFIENVKFPKNTPALGLDDELVEVNDIVVFDAKRSKGKEIDSVFMDMHIPFKAKLKRVGAVVELPTFHTIPSKFEAFDKKGKRVPKKAVEFVHQVEFFNCAIEFEEEVEYYETPWHRIMLY